MREEFSAGGVLFKDGEVLLIKNPSDVWTFPKGLVKAGEKPENTAIREVFEETGVKGKIVAPIGDSKRDHVEKVFAKRNTSSKSRRCGECSFQKWWRKSSFGLKKG